MPNTLIEEVVEQKVETATEVNEESQLIVHCSFSNGSEETLIRIWRSTFLIDKVSGHRSKLIHAHGITIYPLWTQVGSNRVYRFTLIFSGLPRSCTSFDFVEDIPQAGGFYVGSIKRNQMDVYQIELES